MENVQWKYLNLFADREVITTEKSVLLKFPDNSRLKDYLFWFPSKLVRKSRSGKLISLSYFDEFKIQIFKEKTENGKYTKTDQQSLLGKDLYKEFEDMDSKIRAYRSHDVEEDSTEMIYAPKTNI